MEDPGKVKTDAGRDKDIAERLERNPESKEARLDNALDESMDASDPPSSTQPVHNQGPAPSSGYDEEREAKGSAGSHAEEAERQQDA
jgi:hypothetical protein